MKTYLDCYPCFLQQALRAGRHATSDEVLIKKIIDEIGAMLKDIPLDNTPPETGDLIYKKIRELTGNNDPYKNLKQKNIQRSLQMYPDLKKQVQQSKDRLLTAIRMAIAGNVIDMGVYSSFNLISELETILQQQFAIFDYEEFKEKVKKAKHVLYIGDNAGEAVFDKILIEELPQKVIYAVRDIPILNDVTIEEAKQIGIDEAATIVSSGSTAPGTILSACNENFINLFHNADMIISKGQGNYEGLSSKKAPIFFLLKAKCTIIAQNLSVRKNDIVLKRQR